MTPQDPDSVCREYADSGVRLDISLIEPDGDNDATLVHISGDRGSLEFLGKLMIAVSLDDLNRTKQIFPNGPGSAFFAQASSLGLYIQKVSKPASG